MVCMFWVYHSFFGYSNPGTQVGAQNDELGAISQVNLTRVYSWLPITLTLANSNLALTQAKIDFPWISFIHLL